MGGVLKSKTPTLGRGCVAKIAMLCFSHERLPLKCQASFIGIHNAVEVTEGI